MRHFTCDLCNVDITHEVPPHGFSVTVALDTTFFVSGPITRDEASQRQDAKKYLDWCLKCRVKALREALEKPCSTS